MGDSSARKRKIITFSIFDETAYTSRQYSFSHAALFVAGFALLVCLGLFSTFFIRCFTLRNSPADSHQLESRIAGQKQQIDMRNQQIELLGSKLGHLEGSLADLKSLEGEIRHVARIERTASTDQDTLFGVGGSKPEMTEDAVGTDEPASGTDDPGATPGNQDTPDTAELFYAAKHNRLTLVLDHSDFIINPMTCMPLAIPVTGTVQKTFDARKPVTTGEHRMNRGVEIKTPGGAEVVAPANGIVVYAGEKEPLGNTVVIDHGHGIITRYENLGEVTQKAGNNVKKGEIIGFVNDRKADSHGLLYYEVLFNGVQVNPEECVYNPPFTI